MKNRIASFRALIIQFLLLLTSAKQRDTLLRRRRLVNESCTLLIKITEFKDDIHVNSLSCQLENKIYPVDNVPEWLSLKLERDEINSNKDILNLGGSTLDSRGIHLPDNAPISMYIMASDKDGSDRRLLSGIPVTGTFDLLVLRTKTQYGTPTRTAEEISNDIFGTDGDKFNLKSQYQACSYGKLNFNPASHESIQYPGVKNVSVEIDGSDTSTNVENAAIAAAEEIFGGEWNKQNRFNKYYTMVCVPEETGSGWIAYAYINHWLSVYSNEHCSSPSVGIHEIGHNLGLGHSGHDGNPYGDQSGLVS